jgi:glycosyltransferase involved in cell wall biosynthesis
MPIVVCIPIYNAANAVNAVVEDLSSIDWPKNVKFVFLDNHSVDQSVLRLKSAIIRNNLKNSEIYQNVENIGLGGSQKFAIEYGKSNGFDFMAIFHGDFQPTARDLEMGLGIIQERKLDALLGSRFEKNSVRNNYSKSRLWGNKTLNFMYSVRFGRKISDLGSGLNIYKINSLPACKNLPNDLAFNCNLLVNQLKSKSHFEWFPIAWREGLAPSTMKTIKLGLATLKPIFRLQDKHREPSFSSKKLFEYE